MKTKIIEFQPQLGGKIHVYPEKMIWDVGGLLPVTGDKLIEQLVQQGLTFQPEVVLNTKVESIIRNKDGTFTLKANDGEKNTFQNSYCGNWKWYIETTKVIN